VAAARPRRRRPGAGPALAAHRTAARIPAINRQLPVLPPRSTKPPTPGAHSLIALFFCRPGRHKRGPPPARRRL
jgi:hypothetical protein